MVASISTFLKEPCILCSPPDILQMDAWSSALAPQLPVWLGTLDLCPMTDPRLNLFCSAHTFPLSCLDTATFAQQIGQVGCLAHQLLTGSH